MKEKDRNAQDRNAQAWGDYWAGPSGYGESITGDTPSAQLAAYWASFFEKEFAARGPCIVADIACGSGVVTRAAVAAAKAAARSADLFLCVDLSSAGAKAASRAAARAAPVCADAGAPPFADRSIDIAASLFGVEYADAIAFEHIAATVRSGGAFHAVIHMQDGPIARECAENLQLISVPAGADLIARAREAFEAGFALDSGAGAAEAFAAADRRLEPAVRALQEALSSGPRAPARHFLVQVYKDLAVMYQRRQAYAPEDVFKWLANIGGEIVSYKMRMEAMLGAAKSRADIDQIVGVLRCVELQVEAPGELALGGQGAPAAWIVSARR